MYHDIYQLESEVANANDESNAFNKQVIKEFELFQQAKTEEMKQGLVAYADSHIKFYETVRVLEKKQIIKKYIEDRKVNQFFFVTLYVYIGCFYMGKYITHIGKYKNRGWS